MNCMEASNDFEELNVRVMAVTARSKAEVYHRLRYKGQYYLPSLCQTDAKFVAAVMHRTKRVSDTT